MDNASSGQTALSGPGLVCSSSPLGFHGLTLFAFTSSSAANCPCRRTWARKSSFGYEYQMMKMKVKCSIVLFVLICVALGMGGCEGNYAAYPGSGPYYGGPYYGGPYYGGYPASVSIAVGDRPYYVHGPGYYTGHTYYV